MIQSTRMNHMNHHHAHAPSPLEIRQLAEFDASLGEAPEAEKRRKRIVYLRDALRQMHTGASILKGFGWVLIPFAIIPIFWPFLFFFWYMRKRTLALMGTQLESALEYWQLQQDEILGEESNESLHRR